MKLMRKIYGILCLLLLMVATIILSYSFYTEPEDWYEILSLSIMIYIFVHYLILTQFGFTELPLLNEGSRYLKIISIVVLVFFVIIPTSSFYVGNKKNIEYQMRENEEKQEKERIEKVLLERKTQLEKPKAWGIHTTVYGIKCELTTRYLNRKLDYIFKASLPNENKKVLSYYISMQDSAGFEIFQISVSDWANNLDKDGNKYGISANSSMSFGIDEPDSDIENKIESISSYRVAIRSE